MENRFLQLRNEKNLTQEDIANFLKITRQAYSRYERGEREANYATLNSLATFFDVSIDYLLGRSTYFYPDNISPAPMGDALTSNEAAMLKAFRNLLPETQEFVLRSIQSMQDKKSVT